MAEIFGHRNSLRVKFSVFFNCESIYRQGLGRNYKQIQRSIYDANDTRLAELHVPSLSGDVITYVSKKITPILRILVTHFTIFPTKNMNISLKSPDETKIDY